MTHDFDPWLFRRGGNRNRDLALAITIVASLSVSAIQADAGGFKNGANRGGFHESAARAAEADAGPAGGLASNSIDSNGLIGRGLLALGLLRDLVGNIPRGGPGEGSTPHISPTKDWKGQVNTNICNFQYVCQ